MKLYMVMIGCTPPGRFTEQHDIFFGIGETLAELVPQMKAFWPEAKGKIHIDAWREVTVVDGYKVNIITKTETGPESEKLFFINLGGYKQNEFEEYHYKVLATGITSAKASKKAMKTSFYKHYSFKGAESHIDEKYGIDVDNIYKVNDMLSSEFKNNYSIELTPQENLIEDEMHIGYVMVEKLLSKKLF